MIAGICPAPFSCSYVSRSHSRHGIDTGKREKERKAHFGDFLHEIPSLLFVSKF